MATSRGSLSTAWLRNDGIRVICVSIRNNRYTTDFTGERRGVLRTPAFSLAGQLTRWIERNYATLQRLIYGLS